MKRKFKMNKFTILMVAGSLLFGTVFMTQQTNAETITSDQIEWGHLNPARGDASPAAGKLWGDRTKDDASGFLVKFKKGFSSPPHIHNVTYRGVVIRGLLHNDDPKAENMWLPAGSFWTQPAGEEHITAAKDQENMAYIEIDSGPYLVQPADQAFDNGERPVNVDKSNLVWLDASDIKWVGEVTQVKRTFLWGNTKAGELNGNMIKLPAGFKGKINNEGNVFHAVVVAGQSKYQSNDGLLNLEAGNYFGTDKEGTHQISVEAETIIYIRTNGKFNISND
jgi:hypothetical protein